MSAKRSEMDIVIADLRAAVKYSPDSGRFIWNERADIWNFSSDSKLRSWITRFAGRPAFSVDSGNGYLQGSFCDAVIFAHRAAWAVIYGCWLEGQIDHINGIRCDNRICNLRDVSIAENRKNASTPRHNTSGQIGVSFRSDKGKWRAFISASNRSVHLGYFDSKEEAIEARKSAEFLHGFHPNHGRT